MRKWTSSSSSSLHTPRLPEHAPALLTGCATASRTTTTPEVNKIKDTWRTPSGGERGGHWISPKASGDDSSAAAQQAMPTVQQNHDDRPRAPSSPFPATEEAERSSRDIPVAVTLGTEPRGSSFGGAKK